MTSRRPSACSEPVAAAEVRRTANAGRFSRLNLLVAALLLVSSACSGEQPFGEGDDPAVIPAGDTAPPTISIDTETLHQTISGWYATNEAGQLDCLTFARYKDELFDRTVNELGLNRLKLAVRSYTEHRHDYFADYRAGRMTRGEWRETWFHALNDNDDPFVIDPAGFQWSDLDHKIDNLALPMRERLRARGESLFVMLTFTDNRTSEFDHKNAPEEYAEFMLALYEHMQSKYGFVPNIVEVVNEPDMRNVNWTAGQLGAAVAAAGRRLEAAGFTPRFAVPGTANMSTAIEMYDEIRLVPGAAQYIGELSYHRYRGVSERALAAIGERSQRDAIGTTMSEHIGSGYEDLHADLKVGQVSSWMQFALALCGKGNADRGGIYYKVAERDSGPPEIRPQSRTPYLWQYFRYVRSGAQRVEASSTNARLDPLAFVNADGRHVVVIRAEGAAGFSIGGLPQGTYGVTHATPGAPGVSRPDVNLPDGAKLSASIPGAGVITVFGK